MRSLSVAFALLPCVLSASLYTGRDAAEETPTSYDGTRLLRVALSSDSEVNQFKSVVTDLDLDILSEHGVNVNVPVDILVPESQKSAFDSAFGNYTVVHEDLGAAIKEEREGFAEVNAFSDVEALVDMSWFNNYHSYADHVSFVTQLQTQYPNISEVVTSGKSVQGNTITGLHLFGSSGKGVKPAIIFHGTTHAREWISTTTVEYVLYQLVSNYANSTDVKALVDSYDFYIFPVVNPDGFLYSQSSTRLWRKNRTSPPSGSSCYGVDLNRNWGIHWSDSGGASTNPCDEDYKGTAQESTPEIQGLVAFSKNLISTTGIKLYIDFHSYGQLFLYPYGWDCSTNPDSSYYKKIGSTFETALTKIRGTDYTIEQACTLYPTTGASDDYHYGTLGVSNAYTIELPSTSSFVLSASNILPVGRETWEGVFAVLKGGVSDP